MSGYTLAGVAGRIRDLENKTNGAYYVGVCWLAMCRDSGKGAKKRLADKVFGVDKGAKETSTFRNAWRIAEKAFSEGFPAAHRKAVVELALDEAIDFAVKALEAHKTALKVTNMKDYEDVCKYASVETMPAKAEAEPEPEPETETAPEHEGDVDADGKEDAKEGVDVVANIKIALSTLTLEQAMEVAGWLAQHINAASEGLAKAA
ncbi:MAG: hypothetical protein EOR34_10465 [Mesorhizobium sp.]|uniref:hypothetical protein n=1 Tax=Mesorhizobium sp. TaxID=1871066 RepID=UPI000FE8D451|nr:hypothetical protein [Mesorhizobium sp.]RWI48437.1 MAG: hypothetical protein EOR15_13825 [Mesorhizobium sp.]RWI88188.1 MAG: hypothetical protein EOR20_03880 [Mesorhizobium sp.]RWJ60054.1 MAG: hypothetical protein EOR32_19385 [Mesorhizobium sp.]RWJ74304.1 MAG: hypothetical protein EOR34_10465 [Mesorhizobium sp.]TIQ65112.1 MAG: hypothetical protein E5X41_13050 [Mesorhizobium sp.]